MIEVMVLGKFEKTYQKIMEDPLHADMDINEIINFLKRMGFTHRNNGTSHNIFTHPAYEGILTIPTKHGRQVKGIYIKSIREALIDIDA